MLNVVTLNPNLQSISIHWNCSIEFLRRLNNELPRLETLKIKLKVKDYLNDPNFTDDAIHQDIVVFKNVKKFILSIFNFKQLRYRMCFPNIPITFSALEELTVETNFSMRHVLRSLMNRLFGISLKNSTLKKLHLLTYKSSHIESQTFTEFLSNVNQLLYLEDVDLHSFILSVEEIVNFMNVCHSLKKFCCILQNDEIILLQNRISDEWKVSADFECVRLNRIGQ